MTARFFLDGRVVLVTGASSGLGRHFSLTLARAGAKVAVAARRLELLHELVAEIEGFDGRALAISLDVTDPGSVDAAVLAAETELGAIAVLVNNAGVGGAKPALDTEPDEWRRIIDTNLTGAWLMARQTARHMTRLGHGGSIINIASILGLVVRSQVPAYAASKAGLIHLTRALALELAADEIRVNAIAPGYFETDLSRPFLTSGAGRDLVARIPQKRVGEFSDLEGILLLLASDASRYMTGTVTTVDGGYSIS
jgi:NAD(P)-dependent dehydrogenase (short-subunit alcohol dehydrogenase family)